MYHKQHFHIKIKTYLYKIPSIFKICYLALFDSTNIRLYSLQYVSRRFWNHIKQNTLITLNQNTRKPIHIWSIISTRLVQTLYVATFSEEKDAAFCCYCCYNVKTLFVWKAWTCFHWNRIWLEKGTREEKRICKTSHCVKCRNFT